MPEGRAGLRVADALAAGDHIETVLDPGSGHIEQAYPLLLPRRAAGQPGGLAHPEPAVVLRFHRVEDDDRKLPPLEAMRGADLGQRAPARLHVPQCLESGLGLTDVGRDHPRTLAVLNVQFDQCPGQQQRARAVIGEIGLDMSRFPTAAHLVSWAGLCPSARQSGPRTRAGKKGHGNTWLRGALGQAANGAARTATFLGERYHRIARRRGNTKAQSPSPAPSWSSSGTCSPTPRPGSPTSAPATTRPAPTKTRRSKTISGRSKRSSATPSPSPRPRNLIPPLTRPDRHPRPGSAAARPFTAEIFGSVG